MCIFFVNLADRKRELLQMQVEEIFLKREPTHQSYTTQKDQNDSGLVNP